MTTNADNDDALTRVFEERGENLTREDLLKWTLETDSDKALLVKLKGSGAKLLSGPRGSGKSTLFKKAYYALAEEDHVLPVYVNFSQSLALEPLFHKQANALQLFRQWILYRIVVGTAKSFSVLNVGLPEALAVYEKVGRQYLHELETGAAISTPPVLLAPSQLLSLLELWSSQAGRRRAVLLLDDAAHAFSPEQQKEFFEVFRALRSRYVSAKAAVYPGITSYTPNFHVGHEAEVMEAWYTPDEDGYLRAMREMAIARLPPALYEKFEKRYELIDYLALASFGIPRGFLNMLSYVLGVEEDEDTKPTRARAQQAVAIHAESVINVFRSLKDKLPRLRKFVGVGLELQRSIDQVLSKYNENKQPGRDKATVVGIADETTSELERILAMAEYAGLIRSRGSVSRGVKGVFNKYAVHNALIIENNDLSLGKSYPLDDVIRSLSSSNAHAFVRTRITSLLGSDYQQKCTLDLEPCQRCATPRASQDARFCVKCGAELTNVSVYEELVHAPLEKLGLTSNKLLGILEHTNMRTVQDILLDSESEIRNVPYVGAVWAARIRNAALEYVSV